MRSTTKQHIKSVSRMVVYFSIIALIVFFINYYEMASYVWKAYNRAITPYQVLYHAADGGKLNRTWAVVKEYFKSYHPMWNSTTHRCDGKPVSIYKMIFFYLDPLTYYRYNFLERYGCCEEIASAVCALVHDSSGLRTRIVAFKGPNLNHAISEVYYNSSWWVFDISWTTRKTPVKVSNYYSYLVSHNYTTVSCATTIQDMHTFQDLRNEHGFSDKPDPDLCGKNK